VKQCSVLELLEVADDAAPPGAHVCSQSVLAGETAALLPGIAEEHHVGELGARGDIRHPQEGVGDLGEPVPEGVVFDDDGTVGTLVLVAKHSSSGQPNRARRFDRPPEELIHSFLLREWRLVVLWDGRALFLCLALPLIFILGNQIGAYSSHISDMY
jgi:hypothetical protein